MPERLVGLHIPKKGNTGKRSALAPAVVLMSISAFEGFVEDAMATAMVIRGDSYFSIANEIGRWTNPDVGDWGKKLKKHFDVDLDDGFEVKITRGTAKGGWSAKKLGYDESVRLASAWMNVRHFLTHGGASANGAEQWPTTVRNGEPASTALRANRNNPKLHHIEMNGAKGCAALYLYAARQGANLLAQEVGQPALTWNGFPEFDPH